MKEKNILFKFVLVFVVLFSVSLAIAAQENTRTRLVVMADMGCEPDEMQQMVHMLICSNEFEPELLMAVTGKYIRPGMKDKYRQVTHPELFTQIINEYSKVVDNLKKHTSGWHSPEYLHSIVCAGQPEYGIDGVGQGKASEGSKRLAKVFEKKDERPIWIVVNAGSSTLAQALFDYAKTHSETEVQQIIKKLRVFENGAQDNAGAYICNRYPAIHWIRSNYQTYAYGGPGTVKGTDIATIGPHFWGEHEYSAVGQHDWLHENVIDNHGPLGAIFPERRFGRGFGFMEGGGTIPWIGLANKGLFDIDHPSWGGWGGRYSTEKVHDVWSRHKSVRVDDEKHSPFYTHSDVSDVWHNPKDGRVYYSNFVPVWRWRQAMYNDFKCRMDWCMQPFEKANHHPKAVFYNDAGDDIVFVSAAPGERIELDASNSIDPDKDELAFSWWVYEEAGTYAGKVYIDQPSSDNTFIVVPSGAARKQIHLILEIQDKNPIAPLFDYRRIVIDVSGSYEPSR